MRISKIRNSPRIVLSAAQSKSELVQDELLLTDTNNDGFSDNYIVSDYLDGELDDGGQRIFADELAEAEEFLFTPETDIVSTDIVNIDGVSVNKVSNGSGRTPDLKIYGTTLVNLLGKYGNFEVDSNADGLADGWTPLRLSSYSLETGIVGNKSQKMVSNTETLEHAIHRSFTFILNHKYFFSLYALKPSGTPQFYLQSNYVTTGRLLVPFTTTTSWARYSKLFTVTNDAISILYIRNSGNTTDDILYIDGFVAVDLTERGALDPVRAAKYGVANWADLTEAQLEAEIPYFDSVMSVNVKDGTASELTVENRGKNLFDAVVPISGSGQTAVAEQISATSWYISGQFHARIYLQPPMNNKLKPNTNYHLNFVVSEIVGIPKLYLTDANVSAQYTYLVNLSGGVLSKTITTDNGGNIPSCYIFDNLNKPWSCIISYIQLEEGSVATDYVPPRTDSISIPNTCELHGYAGAFNYIDSNGNYVKNWERADKTTDGAGAFTLSGYASGSKVICRNKTNGEVEVLNAAASITTGWAVTNIEILYQLETPLSSIEVVTGSIKLYQGHNNVLSPDSSIPVAISVVNLNNDVTTSNSIVNIDNIINTASYEWNAGNLTSWSMSGRSFVNLLHDSEAVQNNYSRHFKSLEGNTYFDYLNTTIITGDNTYKFVTNSSGTTASMAVYNLTDLGNLTSLEADTANTLAGMVLYSTATLWEDLPEAILTEMLPPYIAQYTKEYTASYIKPISNTVEHHEIPIDLPLLGLKSYNNVINSDGSGTEYAKISDLSEGSFTHLDDVDDIDYVEIELNYDLSQDLEIPEIGVCWDYSSDVSTLTRRVLDTAVEVVWDYSSDVSTLSRRAI